MLVAQRTSRSLPELTLGDSGWLAWAVSGKPQRVNGSFAFVSASLVLHVLFAVALSGEPEVQAQPLAMQAEILIDAPDVVEAPEPPAPEPEPLPEPEPKVRAASNPPPPEPPAQPPVEQEPEQEASQEEPPDVMDNPYADPNFDFSYRRPSEPGGSGTKSVARRARPAPAPSAKAFGIGDGKQDAKLRAERARLLKQWRARVNAVISRLAGRDYPRRARQLRQEGTALLALVIDPSGAVTGVSVTRSSGHPLLDRAALSGASAVRRVPAPPPEVGWRTSALPVPIAFRLQ